MEYEEKQLQGIKIVRVSTVAFFIDSQLHEQCCAIINAGADLTVISSDASLGKEIPKSTYISLEIDRKVNLKKDFSALIKLCHFFRKKQFHIIHSTTPKAGLLCSIAGFLARTPIRIHTFTGQPWVEMKGLRRRVCIWSDKLISMLNTHCYADSASQKEFLISRCICNEDKLSVLGYGSLAGISLHQFNPERFDSEEREKVRFNLNIPEKAVTFIFLGRVCIDKGIRELLNAFSQTLEICEDIHLIIVGPQEVSLNSLLAEYDSKLRERVHVVGMTQHPEQYLVVSDVFVLPSYREGFGTSVIEAAAMELPAIGTEIYGLSDAIVSGETGLLIPVKDSQALSDAMVYMVKNRDIRKWMGGNARDRVKRKFTNSYVNAQVINEYTRLINARPPLQ